MAASDGPNFFENAVHMISGLATFALISVLVQEFILPASWAMPVAILTGGIVLSGFGLLFLSIFFGGAGFDHALGGVVLAVAGSFLVHTLFGWEVSDPVKTCKAKTLLNMRCSLEMEMLSNLFEIAVGMVILFVPLYLVFLLRKLSKSETDE